MFLEWLLFNTVLKLAKLVGNQELIDAIMENQKKSTVISYLKN